jgi:hypothetical protein
VVAPPSKKWKSFRLAVIINLTVNLQPRLLFIRRQVLQNLHQIADHFLTNPTDESRALRRNADHDLAAVIPRNRTHHVAEIFETRDQTARRRGRVPHLLRNRGHGKDFFLVEEREKEKLREGNIAGRKFLTQMQHEAALHFENDVGKPLRIRTNLIGRISCKRDGGPRVQRA